MKNNRHFDLFVGIDEGKNQITVAIKRRDGSVVYRTRKPKTRDEVRCLVHVVRGFSGDALWGYEAGIGGYTLYRWISEAGEVCHVIPASQAGARRSRRNKTDRLDAAELSDRLIMWSFDPCIYRPLVPPTQVQEYDRDLVRRYTLLGHERDSKITRLKSILARYGHSDLDGMIDKGDFVGFRLTVKARGMSEAVIEDELLGIEFAEARREVMGKQLKAVAKQPGYAEAVTLFCLKPGLAVTTVIVLLLEIHDIGRFPTDRSIANAAGLTDGVVQSGDFIEYGAKKPALNRNLRYWLILGAMNFAKFGDPAAEAPAWFRELVAETCAEMGKVVAGMAASKKAPKVIAVARARIFSKFIWRALTRLANRGKAA